eukprot:scaffold37874_cov31-Tisochrysis_lutea.AAC.1
MSPSNPSKKELSLPYDMSGISADTNLLCSSSPVAASEPASSEMALASSTARLLGLVELSELAQEGKLCAMRVVLVALCRLAAEIEWLHDRLGDEVWHLLERRDPLARPPVLGIRGGPRSELERQSGGFGELIAQRTPLKAAARRGPGARGFGAQAGERGCRLAPAPPSAAVARFPAALAA